MSETRRRPASKRKPRTRVPRQARAQQTVDAILQATRNLAVRDGFDRVTTNAVAKAAGVSIGSLYQYFESLEAIVEELSRRHVEAVLKLVFAEVEAMATARIEVGVRRMVRLMLDVHRQDPDLHRAIQASLPSLGARAHLARVEEQMLTTAVAYLRQHRDELVIDDLERAAFICVGTIEAVTHNTVVARPQWLADEGLVDDVTRMLVGYLTGRALMARA